MTQQTYLLEFFLTTWVSGGLCASLLLLTGWRQLSAFFLSIFSLVITFWAYECYQAIYVSQIIASSAYLKMACLIFICIPPMFYHFICLAIKNGWPNRISILVLYVLNFSFMNALELRNFLLGNLGSGQNYLIQFSLFSDTVSILYRIVFFITLGMAVLRLVEFYPKAPAPIKMRLHYLALLFPFCFYGFFGVPGFTHLLFGMVPRMNASFGFLIFAAGMGYVLGFQRMAALQNALTKTAAFTLLILTFVFLNQGLTEFLRFRFGITGPRIPWAGPAITAFAFGLFLVIYDVIQTIRNRQTRSHLRGNQSLILDVANQVLSAHQLNDSVQAAAEFLIERLGLNGAAFLLRNTHTGAFSVSYSCELDMEKLQRFHFGKSLIEWLVKKKQPFILSESEQTMLPSTFHQLTYSLKDLPIELCHPLFLKNNVLAGVLLLGNQKKGGSFSSKDMDLLFVVGTVLATAIEHNQLSDQAVVDGLTHLYHQKYFKTRLDEQIKLGNQNKSAMAVVMLDIDYFKKLNDTYGHQAGDKVLESVAKALKETVRANDVLARYGGEEFALFIEENQSQPQTRELKSTGEKENLLNAAERLAEKIRSKVEKHAVIYNDHLFQVTVSVGVGFKAENEITLSAQELIHRADQALYAAKQDGRNRVVIATQSGIRKITPSPSSHKPSEHLKVKHLNEPDLF